MANIQFQFRRGTASQWTSANPVLAAGEMGIETDTDKFKIGDGSTATSGRSSNSTYIQFSDVMNTSRNNLIMHLQNYSNTSVYKTILSRTNTPATSGGASGTV